MVAQQSPLGAFMNQLIHSKQHNEATSFHDSSQTMIIIQDDNAKLPKFTITQDNGNSSSSLNSSSYRLSRSERSTSSHSSTMVNDHSDSRWSESSSSSSHTSLSLSPSMHHYQRPNKPHQSSTTEQQLQQQQQQQQRPPRIRSSVRRGPRRTQSLIKAPSPSSSIAYQIAIQDISNQRDLPTRWAGFKNDKHGDELCRPKRQNSFRSLLDLKPLLPEFEDDTPIMEDQQPLRRKDLQYRSFSIAKPPTRSLGCRSTSV